MSAVNGTGQAAGGAKKQGLNLRPLKLYVAGYIALIVLFAVSVLGGGDKLSPRDLAGREIVGVRVKEAYSFRARSGAAVQFSKGQRVDGLLAQELAAAIAEDRFPYESVTVFKPGWFWNLDWAYIFTFYNLFGMFGGLYLLLKSPLVSMLESKGLETEQGLSDARAAIAGARELNRRYDNMLAELETERQKLASTLREEEDIERERIMRQAKHEAAGIVESVRQSIDSEIAGAAQRLRAEVVRAALAQASERIEQGVTAEDHEAVLNDFISDLERMAK